MTFHSFTFFFFFIIVYALYISLEHRQQNRMLLIASYVFYSFWDWRFLSLILISTVTDFICAQKIDQSKDKAIRKRYVFISCLVNLSILGFFKYFNFFADNLLALFSVFGVQLDLPILRFILPVGISFYTFQSISYTIDVYRKQLKPTDNFLDYALYVSFFPQLVAGPIERGRNLLPQIIKPRSITKDNITEGLHLIYLGIFKKLVLAENLAAIVNPVFHADGGGSGGLVLVAGYAFLFQVYCDFSAYTDFARGTSKLMGINIMENFRAPYFAANIQEFWNRWHISLTTWIRDYLYYPLAFKRFGKKSIDVKLLTIITFLVMGLWHGAAWNFVLWGGFHGVALAFYAYYTVKKKSYKGLRIPLPSWVLLSLSVALTFHVCFIGDIFFRAQSFNQAFTMLYVLFFKFSLDAETIELFIKLFIFALPMVLLDIVELKFGSFKEFLTRFKLLRYPVYYAFFYLIIFYNKQNPDFIYFQF